MRILKRALIALPASLILFFVVGVTSCTSLSRHTTDPFDADPRQAKEIEDAAAAWCKALGEPEGPPPLPFRFDGCSWWPDGEYKGCCECHDYAYWCGGSAELREKVDEELRSCVARRTGSDGYGWLMKQGVRAGGHPVVPMYFRWGYGHAYDGSYPENPAPASSALPTCTPLSDGEHSDAQ